MKPIAAPPTGPNATVLQAVERARKNDPREP
jgi:hypothetical protein